MLVSPIIPEVPHRPARRCGAGITVRRSRWRANRQLSRVRAHAIHADTHQNTPHFFFDTPGLSRTASRAPGSAHGLGAATEPPISVSRPGPKRGRTDRRGWTAVDTRSTSRTQSAELTAVGSGSEQKKGERTPEAPLAEKSPGTSREHRSTTRTLRDAQKSKVGIRRKRAGSPPCPITPPGSQERWALRALPPPPKELPRAATQQAKPEQPLRNQRQRWHRLRHHRLRRVGHGNRDLP